MQNYHTGYGMQLVIGALVIPIVWGVYYTPYALKAVSIQSQLYIYTMHTAVGHDNLLGKVAFVHPAAVKILKW